MPCELKVTDPGRNARWQLFDGSPQEFLAALNNHADFRRRLYTSGEFEDKFPAIEDPLGAQVEKSPKGDGREISPSD
jgi:hypothetical protein